MPILQGSDQSRDFQTHKFKKMIQGYPNYPGVFPGEAILLHVSTTAPLFRIDIYRQGITLDYQVSTGNLEGFFAADHDHDQDWGTGSIRRDGTRAEGWPPYEFIVPGNFQTGVYIALFIELDEQGNPNPGQPPVDNKKADARTGKALFVVKNPFPGVECQLLYKLPYFTYQSYNYQGGGSIYQAVDINLHRPGGGTGGTPWDALLIDNFDPFDRDSPRNVFEHWDTKFISWLEQTGFRVDYCTDWDIHQDDGLSLLSNYSLMLSVGHDEYYTEKMRNSLESFISAGGNIAFFSGNTCWWRTEFNPVDPFLMFGQQTIHHWFELGRPEDSLTGVSYRNGGERDAPQPASDDEKVGYTVQNSNLWPFENTGLKDGDIFAKDECIIGYECDGAPFDKNGQFPFIPTFNDTDGTPRSFIILGTADVSKFNDLPYRDNNLHATMGIYSNAGTVFTGATTDWPRVAWQGEANTVQITKNVIDRLGGNPKGLAVLPNVADILCIDGFYSEDDGYRHAIVGSRDGAISEIFFHPQAGNGITQIIIQNGLIDLGCFYTRDDTYRHVITALSNGDIHEIFFNPQTGLGSTLLGNIPNAISVSGFYTSDDNYRHAIVATSDGDVIELFYHPDFGAGQSSLGNFGNIVDIGCFYTTDDNYRHVIVGNSNGDIIEIFYHPQHGIFNTVIANIPGLLRLSGYIAENDHFFNRRVQVLTQNSVHEVRYHPDFGVIRALLINVSDVHDLGAFFSPDDEFRHSILAFSSGEIKELFFNP